MGIGFASCSKDDDNGSSGGNGNNGGNNGGGGGNSNIEWVDLGLPSGVLWADRNIGSSAPEDCGSYFAWGETQPKTSFSWDNYRYGNGDYSLTKYCNDSDYGLDGFVDGLIYLQDEDDAAIVNLGNGARTPTWDEWIELIEYCSTTPTTLGGVWGLLFTANNGNTIFMPAAGIYELVRPDQGILGSVGYYWAANLDDFHNPPYAKSCHFTLDEYDGPAIGNEYRWEGLPVRPVRSAHK